MHLSYVRILVDRFADCFRFYRDLMGFEVLWGGENDVYAEFKVSGQTRLAVTSRQVVSVIPGVTATAAAGDRFMLVFEVEDVDKTAASLKERGVAFVSEPVTREAWGVRTMHLRDPDGNLVEINKPLHR
jgi:lactoylglutathione lyase